MSNFVFILILFFFNSILLISLILSSISKKSPRRLIKFFFMPILLSLFISLAIQFQLQISEISFRQLFVNLIVILWLGRRRGLRGLAPNNNCKPFGGVRLDPNFHLKSQLNTGGNAVQIEVFRFLYVLARGRAAGRLTPLEAF